MVKSLTLTCLFLHLWRIGFSQTTEAVNSLHHQLATAKHDTSRIKVQAFLCLLHRLGNNDSSIWYGQQALKRSREINFQAGEILALSFMSIAMEQQGNFPKALEMAFKAIQIADANRLNHLRGGALNAIGETYIILKDYPKALHYLRLQKANALANKDDEGLAYSNYDIGVAYYEMNQLDSAAYYETMAIKDFHKYGREEPLIYKTLGDVELKSGNIEKALKFYKESLRISLRNNERRASAYAYNKIAAYYRIINKPDSAIYYAHKGLRESQLINQKKTILDAATMLSELYEPKDTRTSLQYLKIAGSYKDSIFGAGNIEAVQTLATQEEKRQSEIAAASIAYKNKLRQYGLIAVLVTMALVAFILYRNNRKERKAKLMLQNKNVLIEQTLDHLKSTQQQLIHSEKMASLGELTAGIAHEIQNPLNFVNNFSDVNGELVDEAKLEMDQGNIDEVKAILNDIKDNEQKINHHGKRADAIVKGMLQHSRNSSGQKEPTGINALVDEYLRLAYHGLKAKDKSFNAKFETDFDNSIGKINIVPQEIGRVILNLINNAFYAVNEKKKQMSPSPNGVQGTASSMYEPVVTVTTKRLGPPLGDRGKPDSYRVEIRVADNGNGIPQKVSDKIFQPFFTTKPTGQGTGLGLSLSYDIVKAHGGEIKVETKDDEGSQFIIELPTS